MAATVDRDRELLRHFLAAIAYRTQKALRGAPERYPELSAGSGARTPVEILRHMTSLMGYTQTLFLGGSYPKEPEPLPAFADEIARFHGELQRVAELLESGHPLRETTTEQLLQGPLADAMTHAGQLALLRRLARSPVASEDFIFADVRGDRLGIDQAPPARPDPDWTARLESSPPSPAAAGGHPAGRLRSHPALRAVMWLVGALLVLVLLGLLFPPSFWRF